MSESMLKETEILLVVRDQQTATELTRYVQHETYERRVSRSITLGQATISLADFEELTTRRQVRWCLLEDASSQPPHTDMMVSLFRFLFTVRLISPRYVHR